MLIVISGFSGVGKGTAAKRLVEKYGYSLSVSATTRAPREGEQDGREYYFKTVEEFRNLIDYNGFIEYAQYVENYYGTPRAYVEKELAQGHHVILEIEVEGAKKIKEQYPNAILIFISADGAQELKDRLTGRGTEEAAVIEKRMKRAREEAMSIPAYEYFVVNRQGALEECVDEIHAIVTAKQREISAWSDKIEKIQNELKAM
jgi:guanylate kinase